MKNETRPCLKYGNTTSGEGLFSPDKGDLTQEYWMYFKENPQSMVEKDPPIGGAAIFQTGPNPR